MAYIGRQQDGFGVRSRFIYTATAGQTTFDTDDSSNALSYSDGAYVDVYLNGVLLDPSDYTATSFTSIVLDAGAAADDVLEVIVYDVFSVFSGTFTNGITASEATVTGDLTVDTDTLFVDASLDKVGMGTSSPDADASVLSIKGSDPTNTSEGQILIHGSATSGAADTGTGIGFKGHNGAGNRNLGSIQCLKENGTSGNIDTYMRFVTRSNTGGIAEAMRIDSSGDVLVGKTSQTIDTVGAELLGSIGKVHATRDGGASAGFNRKTSDGDIAVFYKDGATVGSIKCRSNGGNLQIDTGQSGIDFAGDGYLPMRNGSITDNSLDIGSSSFRYADLYLSGSVYLGGTGSANALDDYEEGNWTPSIEFGGTAATTTVTRARYIKVGSLVSLSATITCASTPASGLMTITNLPFSPSINVETTGNVMCNNVNTETGTVNLVTYHYNLNNTSIFIYGTRDNSTWYYLTDSHVSSGDQFIFTHTYYIS